MSGELTLTAVLHRPAYQAMPTPQQAYVLFEALPSQSTPAVRQMVNFCLVLDRSGSMAGEKLMQLKAAADLVVDRLGSGDMLSVILFDETSEILIPTGAVLDHQTLKSRIDQIEERGGTHMSTGMQAGLSQLQHGQSTGRVSRLLLLTDGQTWEDQAACESLADQCRAAGIPINVMGLGIGADSNWDPRFLENLAQRSGGEWMVIDTPTKASLVFESILQDMQTSVVTNASLTIRFVAGVQPRAVWRVIPLISRLGQSQLSPNDVQVFLGDIQHKLGQNLLLDVLLPEHPSGTFRLIQADVQYDVPATGLTHQRTSVEVVVPFTDDINQTEPVDPRMMNLIERLVAHKLQTQALDEAASGDIQRATVRLRAAATRLLDLGEEEMAQVALEQAQQMEQAGSLDPAAAQQMRYATKRLTETDLP